MTNTFSIKAWAGYKPNKHWNFTLSWDFRLGNYYTAMEDIIISNLTASDGGLLEACARKNLKWSNGPRRTFTMPPWNKLV